MLAAIVKCSPHLGESPIAIKLIKKKSPKGLPDGLSLCCFPIQWKWQDLDSPRRQICVHVHKEVWGWLNWDRKTYPKFRSTVSWAWILYWIKRRKSWSSSFTSLYFLPEDMMWPAATISRCHAFSAMVGCTFKIGAQTNSLFKLLF